MIVCDGDGKAMSWLVRKWRGGLHRYAPAAVKRWLWDREFQSGKWDCLEQMAGDCLYPYIEKYAHGGSILDLGCGPGATANNLPQGSYACYVGVDISETALEKARARSARDGRSLLTHFQQGDLARYQPAQAFNVIVFGDSLYYVPASQHAAVLARYATCLLPNGVMIVRLNGARPVMQALLHAEYAMLEEQCYWKTVWVLVCQRRG